MTDSPFATAQVRHAPVITGLDSGLAHTSPQQSNLDFSAVLGQPEGVKLSALAQRQSELQHESASDEQAPSAGNFIKAELTLMGSLPQHFGTEFKDNLKNNWGTLAVEAGVSVVAGAA